MITMKLKQPKFNPENVDYAEMNNDMVRADLTKMIDKNLYEIDWVINLIYSEVEKVDEHIHVDEAEYKATYHLVYNFKGNNVIDVTVVDWGDKMFVTLTLRNKTLVEFTTVYENETATFKKGVHKILDDSLDVFILLKEVLR